MFTFFFTNNVNEKIGALCKPPYKSVYFFCLDKKIKSYQKKKKKDKKIKESKDRVKSTH